MTREDGPERTQRTVAELLAKYGGSPEESTPRRRRRRAEDAEETAPQAIIDRVMSDSGNLPRVGADGTPDQPQQQPPPAAAPRAGHAAPTSRHRPVPQPSQQLPQPSQQLPQPPQPSQQLPKPQPSQQLPQPSQQLPRPDPAQALQPTQRAMPPVAPPERRRQDTQQRPVPQPSQQLPQPSQQLPQPPQPSQQLPRPQQSGGWPAPPAEPGGLAARLDGRADSRSDLRPAQEGVTEQMPRISDEPPPGAIGTRSGQYPTPQRVARTGRTPQPPQPSMSMPAPAFPQHEPDEPDNYPTEYHGFGPVVEQTQFVESLEEDYDDEPERPLEHDRPVGVDDYDEDEDEKPRQSPLREWLSMAGQLAIGVVGGAALWLGFNWLWGKLPTAALVVALVVTVGMVWVVRKIRHQEDLWTTIITMLVSLVITMSPVLLNR